MSAVVDRSREPRLPPPRPVRIAPLRTHMVSAGLRVATMQVQDLPVTAVRLVVRAGAVLDDGPSAGLASLTADMLDEGTRTRGALDLASALEDLGTQLEIAVDRDATVLSLQVLSDRLEPALEILAEVAREPAFGATDFARKKRERLNALLQNRDEPAVLAANALARAIYGESHPYGRPAHGLVRTIDPMDRGALVRFHDAHYRPAAAFLVLVGDTDRAQILPRIERLFDGWSVVESQSEPPPVPAAPWRPGVWIVDRPDAAQSELRVGHEGPSRGTPDYFPLLVANTILGGSFTSRLNSRLREEKGFTYGVRSRFAFRRAGGPFVVGTAVDTRVTAEAVSDILSEMRSMRESEVPADELQRARNFLVLGLPRRFETVGAAADHAADLLLHELGADYYHHFASRIEAVDPAAVLEAARRHLHPDAASVVAAGDAARVAADLAHATGAEPQVLDVDTLT